MSIRCKNAAQMAVELFEALRAAYVHETDPLLSVVIEREMRAAGKLRDSLRGVVTALDEREALLKIEQVRP